VGYGKEFIEALHKNIGIADIADIDRAIDELKRDLGVKKVYLIGNSYGGYLALKGIADLSHKVDGAISINGVSNWYSLISRIPSSPFSKLFEGSPDLTNLQAYFSSEVFSGLVNNVRNEPIVVVYGERDSTVPVWQSTEYIEFAKAKGKNVTALALPTEDHILRERASLDLLCSTVKQALNQSRLTCGLR
jgi:dipeptidyl aminopeptidase/acylaminoacyl peptidase